MSWEDFIDQANGFSIFTAVQPRGVRSIQQVASDHWSAESPISAVNGLMFSGWAMADASGEKLVYA